MTRSQDAPRFRPAARLLALIMGVSLLVIGIAGLVWHLAGLGHWLLGENIGVDIFHLVMGVLALGAGGTRRSARAYGGFAFVVFIVATAVSGVGVMMAAEHHTVAGVPAWLAENALGFSDINYIVFLLMALWGLQLANTKPEVDPWGSGDAHSTLRAMPDREDAVIESRNQLAPASTATD